MSGHEIVYCFRGGLTPCSAYLTCHGFFWIVSVSCICIPSNIVHLAVAVTISNDEYGAPSRACVC